MKLITAYLQELFWLGPDDYYDPSNLELAHCNMLIDVFFRRDEYHVTIYPKSKPTGKKVLKTEEEVIALFETIPVSDYVD